MFCLPFSLSAPRALLAAAAVFAASLLGKPVPAIARDAVALTPSPVGETTGEIEQRYGPVRRHNARIRHHQVLEGGSVIDGDLYEKNGIIIRVVYQGGRAVLLEYTRGAGPLTNADVVTILAACAGEFTWNPGDDSTEATKLYKRSDNRAVAHWTTEADGSLLIAAEDVTSFHEKLLP